MRRLLIGLLLLGAYAGATAATASAQYVIPPNTCPSGSRTGYAYTGWSHPWTYAQGGPRVYSIKYDASAAKCHGRTRVIFSLYWDTTGFPSDRYVRLVYLVRRSDGRWGQTCDFGQCSFKLDPGTRGPIFGALPIIGNFRTPRRLFITDVRVVAGALQDNGSAGGLPAFGRYDKTLKLHQGRLP